MIVGNEVSVVNFINKGGLTNGWNRNLKFIWI